MSKLKEAMVGSWRLLTFNVTRPGKDAAPWGKGAHGLLIYSADGWMSLSVNRVFESTMEDFKGIYDASLFYAGRYEVKAEPRVVQHLTEASNPQKIGRIMERDIWVAGNQLTMNGWGDYGTSQFIWERA